MGEASLYTSFTFHEHVVCLMSWFDTCIKSCSKYETRAIKIHWGAFSSMKLEAAALFYFDWDKTNISQIWSISLVYPDNRSITRNPPTLCNPGVSGKNSIWVSVDWFGPTSPTCLLLRPLNSTDPILVLMLLSTNFILSLLWFLMRMPSLNGCSKMICTGPSEIQKGCTSKSSNMGAFLVNCDVWSLPKSPMYDLQTISSFPKAFVVLDMRSLSELRGDNMYRYCRTSWGWMKLSPNTEDASCSLDTHWLRSSNWKCSDGSNFILSRNMGPADTFWSCASKNTRPSIILFSFVLTASGLDTWNL